MTERLIVGTRRSRLARAQTELVVRALVRRRPGIEFRIRPLTTSGDRDQRPGTSPDFTSEIDRELRSGGIDLAVHSAKDLPATPVPGLALAACPRRADPRDCLVIGRSAGPRSLPKGARVGSSSLRRRAQLLRWRPDLRIVEVRGNVDRRLQRVRDGELEAAILAVAGLRRLGRTGEIGRILPTSAFLPAPAQGSLAIMARAGDRRAMEIAGSIDAATATAEVRAERAFAAALGGDCRVPLGALARARGHRLVLVGEVLSPDGRIRLRCRAEGTVESPDRLGAGAAVRLLSHGADALLAPR